MSRFRSAFYSRKLKGYPSFDVNWNDHEEIAFEEFPEANDLAEVLFEDSPLGRKAFAAMKSIRHTSRNQSDWFYVRGNFLQLCPPIWIIRQESFESDFDEFLSRAGYGVKLAQLDVPNDPKSMHTRDYTKIPPLSDKAKQNLTAWYAQDFEFYRMCDAWLEANKSSR